MSIHRSFFSKSFPSQQEMLWPYFTALKLTQDKDDAGHIDIHACLPFLDDVKTPHGEDAESVMRYNQAIQTAYKNRVMSSEDYYQMFLAHGLRPAIAREAIVMSQEFETNPAMTDRIRKVYPEMIKRYEKEGIEK
jgi:hypothetical protein